jgi:hypothetical protein
MVPSLACLSNEAREGFVMATVAAHRTGHQNESHRTGHQNDFCAVAEPFVQGEGLPFTDVLDAESIQRVFREKNALFGQDDIFSTQIVLWAFLAQTLRDRKGAACSAGVSDIATYMLQTGQRPPSGDTGDYCRARAKLSLPALRSRRAGSGRVGRASGERRPPLLVVEGPSCQTG